MKHIARLKGITLLEFSFDFILLLAFSLQCFVAVCLLLYGYIPIPSEWANRVLAEKDVGGIHIQAERFRLKLNGELQLSGVQVHSERTRLPIVEADNASIKYQLWADGALKFQATKLVVSKGTLYLPAVYAPDGERSPILERMAFHLNLSPQLLRFDSFAALHEDIHLRGRIEWPLDTLHTGPQSSDAIGRFYQLIASALREKQRFSPFIRPTLAFDLHAEENDSIQITARLSCDELQYADATAENFSLDAAIQLQDGILRAQSPLRLRAKALDLPGLNISARSLTGHIAQTEWTQLLRGSWPDFEIAARQLSVQQLERQIELQHPKVAISPMAQLNEGFALDSASFKINGDKLTANGITFDHLLAHGSFTNGGVDLHDILVQRGPQWLDAKFSLNRSTKDYTLALIGSAIPYEYNALLPHWWAAIFRDFDFTAESNVRGDFIIHGNTQERAARLYWGHAAVHNIHYKGVPIERGEVIVRGRGRYVELNQLRASSGEGSVNGELAFTSRKDGIKVPVSVRYAFESEQMPLYAAQQLFGENVRKLIQDFELTERPHITLHGVHFNKAYPEYAAHSHFTLNAETQAPLTFKQLRLDYLKFTLNKRADISHLRELTFGYAQGTGTGAIDILTPQNDRNELRFTLALNDANQALALQNLPTLEAKAEDKPTRAKASEQESYGNGSVDLRLHARGPLDNLYQYHGYGDCTVRNQQLGAIQLLGPLSRLLQNTPLNFTSFNLETMQAQFEIAQHELRINQLQIDGPQTQIKAKGTVQLEDQALDMRVRVNLFANLGNPDSPLRKLGSVISRPLKNLLEFDLTGTVQEQKLRSLFDPRNLIPGL
jgi:hypothetical protein